jgi:protein-disulfide isomerase
MCAEIAYEESQPMKFANDSLANRRMKPHMKCLEPMVAAVLCLLSLGYTLAQTPGRRPTNRQPAVKPPAAVATPTPLPAPVATKAATTSFGPLAIVNGQTITVADLEPAVAEEMGKLGQRIAEARVKLLEVQINTVLLDLESRKRKLSPQQLYDAEVTKRIVEPTDLEIKQFIEANKDQLTGNDPQNLKTQVVAFLHGEREEKLSIEFVRRLRASIPVVPGVDINGANISATAVVATVGGQPITAGVVNDKLIPISYKLQLDTYQIAMAALNRTINDVLLIAEAGRRKVPPEEMVRAEITDKLHNPTQTEIAKFYSDNKASISADLSSASNQIAAYLQEQEQERLERAFSDRLRQGAQIRVLLSEPVQLAQTISVAGSASRGDGNARVTLVEFTDFECPACASMQPLLEEVLKSFGDRVRFVVRNYPLTKHPHARKAAEAAEAANAQGKYFEYTSLLFKRQSALDPASLKKYASELGLDRARFDAELDGDKYAALVKHDMDDAVTYGVEGTPTIFINGVKLREMTAAGLHAAIDRAFGGSTPPPR